MNKKHQLNMTYLIGAAWLLILLQMFLGHQSSQMSITYREFEQFLEQGWVTNIVVDEQYIRGELKSPIDGNDHFITPRLDIDLAQKLSQYNVNYKGTATNNLVAAVISWVMPIALFFFGLVFLHSKNGR
ncbi:MAG: ATP-dependent metallopeptidase FtsH/Yme1/Tma family protein [Pseudomonadales bacterium]|nr:ATP-dependent metallopeptidase FtsH/Yme1/Tma family protein [Pseudomonadales bacterium]